FFSLGKAYQSGDFSVVYPMARGLGVAIVPVGAYYFFDERLSRLGILGIVLIGSGIFALHWRRGAWSEGALLRPGTGWAIVTGLCIASYSLVDKVGVSHINPLPYLWAMMLGPAYRSCRPSSGARAPSRGSGGRTGSPSSSPASSARAATSSCSSPSGSP